MRTPITPAGPPRYVTNCSGDPTVQGSLPYEVGVAPDGATIDLSTLACSVITLDTAVAINQDSLYLKGPAAGPSHLTIDGSYQSEVINHFGSGTLIISNLTIANGKYVSGAFPRGGCIYSQGIVALYSSVVSQCEIGSSSDSVPALGGGVYTRGNLTLLDSIITASQAVAVSGAAAKGGGAYVKGNFLAFHSTISNNTAVAPGGGAGVGDGGAAYTNGDAYIEGSTISGNAADSVGGLDFEGGPSLTAKIVNSTISTNTATIGMGGIWTNIPLTLTSSTVAFNRAPYTPSSGGLFLNAPLNLQSSIIADNTNMNGPSDLTGIPATPLSGADNLITSSTLPPLANTITDCPQLGPLAINGGTTRTHALRHTSSAINQGDAGTLTLDQRGAPRTAGVQADIGSVEWQPGETDERIFVNGFDGLCDQ